MNTSKISFSNRQDMSFLQTPPLPLHILQQKKHLHHLQRKEAPSSLHPSTHGGVRIRVSCPVCMMVGQFQQPLFCPNGHPCCTSCFSRVTCCPLCRSSGSWRRCFPMERVGSWLLERGVVGEPSPPAFLSTPPLNVSGGDKLYTLLSDTLIIDISLRI